MDELIVKKIQTFRKDGMSKKEAYAKAIGKAAPKKTTTKKPTTKKTSKE